MKPRERVLAALNHEPVDRIPRLEIWIDGLLAELGYADPQSAAVGLGQDGVMLPSRTPPGSNAWRDGVDEFGRVWVGGMYVDGVVDTDDDLARYSPEPETVDQYFDPELIAAVRRQYPNHPLIFGTHVGPFTASYLAMGFTRFFTRLYDDISFVCHLLHHRTEWCLALYQKAVELGAEVLVLADDAGHREGPMISPAMWRELVLPLHRRIVRALDAPVIWHSDGSILPLLPMAIEAGFAGVHGLEPAVGIDLGRVKHAYGDRLALAGNVDVRVLCDSDLAAVRAEVDRCLAQGGPGGGYLLATCNSIFTGMNPAAVAELFRYEAEAGG